jgi:hypothetical protein
MELQLEAAQQEQVKPKDADEMPVDGGVVKKAAAHGGTRGNQAGSKIDEGEDAREGVENMDEGKEVEERAVGIAGEIDALSAELLPGGILADAKNQAKGKRKQQPGGTFAGGARLDEAAGSKGAARKFQRGTAGEKDEGVEVKHGGQCQMAPVRGAFADEESAGESGEGHGDGKNANPNAAAGSAIGVGGDGDLSRRSTILRNRHGMRIDRGGHA